MAECVLRPVRALVGHDDAVAYVALSADGGVAVSTSFDGTARTWDIGKGVGLAVFGGHRGAVRQCGLSADGRVAATAGRDRTVRVWDASAGAELFVLRRGGREATGVCLSRDGGVVYATFGSVDAGGGDDAEVVRAEWRCGGGVCVWTEPLAGFSVRLGDCAAVSRDGRVVLLLVWRYCAQRRGGVVAFDMEDGAPVHFFGDHAPEVAAALDAAGRVYVADNTGLACYAGGLRCDGRLLARWENFLASRGGAGVAVSADGGVVVASARVGYRLWRRAAEGGGAAGANVCGGGTTGGAGASSGDCGAETALDGHSAFGHSVAVSEDGATVVTACFDGIVRVFSIR